MVGQQQRACRQTMASPARAFVSRARDEQYPITRIEFALLRCTRTIRRALVAVAFAVLTILSHSRLQGLTPALAERQENTLGNVASLLQPVVRRRTENWPLSSTDCCSRLGLVK